MTHRGRGTSFVVSGGVRGGRGRLTEWFGSALPTIKTIAGGVFALDQVLTAVELAKRPFTITRTVGSILVANDQVIEVQRPFGGFGMAVVSEQAIAAGAASLPDPVADIGSDLWFLYRDFGAVGGPVSGQQFTEFAFDSRAQRKVEDGSEIAVMIGNNAAGTHVLLYVLQFRMLVKVS